jgi:methylenetetrahydrofolate reductase (NADPH)
MAEPRPSRGAWAKPTLRRLLEETDRFVVVAELVTSRGVIAEESGRRILRLARELAEHPRIDAVSITDNPGGNPMLGAETLGVDLISRGQEVIIHVACKDRNRNALQSLAWRLSSEGFRNVLALSGDYPVGGHRGSAVPVFDIDSVGLLRMLSDMNEGAPGRDGRRSVHTDFFLGAVVTNHKRHESEVMPQYFKLRKKLENGARFVVNQVGYHARKDDELLRWLEHADLEAPVIANVFVLTPAAARVFNAGRIPGVVVTDELLAVAEREGASPDRGRAFFLELAAKQVAVARGLGFRGAYVGGHLTVDEYDAILERADSFGPEDWRTFVREIAFAEQDEFHFFERDEETGLSSPEVNRAYAASKTRGALRLARLRVSPAYKLNRLVHDVAFEPGAPLFAAGRAFYGGVERGPEPVRSLLHGVEHAAKMALFRCRDCGDCSLPEIAFLCPESQCVKNQRNGPCGGTRDGLCEVVDKECIWARAYDRLKPYGKEESMLEGPAVLKDGALAGTSAWANAFLGRDHHARRREDEAAPAEGEL